MITVNVHGPFEGRNGVTKDSFYEELKFLAYCMKMLPDFTVKVGGENHFKLMTEKEKLCEISNDKNKFCHVTKCNYQSYSIPMNTVGLLLGRCNQIDHFLVDKRWHSSRTNVSSFSGANCGINHCLVVAKIRERCQ
jgi:hypothetical protein